MSSVFTVATANVNGIRAADRRGMGPWLATRPEVDVLCLQEVRAPDDAMYAAVGTGWAGVHQEGSNKGRAGVAVLVREDSEVGLESSRVGLGDGEFATAGRWVEAELEVAGKDGARKVTVISAYVPTGEAGTPRQEEKHRFLDAAFDRLEKLRSDGGEVLLCGDLNVCHREVDLKNWKGNVKKAGFLPAERAWFDRLLDEYGWVDVHRRLAGEGPGPYTWWSWRGQAFDNDTGWRIDYQIASPGLGASATTALAHRAATYAERWSDHAPVTAGYDV